MNWTGGRLQRHSKKGQGNAVVNKQKAYFAKARTNLLHGPIHIPVFSPSFLNHDRNETQSIKRKRPSHSPQRQQTLDEFQEMLPVVRRLESMSASQQSMSLPIPKSSARPSNTTKQSSNRIPAQAARSSDPTNQNNHDLAYLDVNHQPLHEIRRNQLSPNSEQDYAIPQDSLDSAAFKDLSIQEKRRELLNQGDWVGLRWSRPLHLDFASDHGASRIAKRRKINEMNHPRREDVIERARIPSVDERYMMSGAILKPHHQINDILKIRIGEEALTTQSVHQSSHFPEPRLSQGNSSSSVMLHDEQVMEEDNGFILLDDDEEQEEFVKRQEPRLLMEMEQWDNNGLSQSDFEQEPNVRSVYQSPNLPIQATLPDHANVSNYGKYSGRNALDFLHEEKHKEFPDSQSSPAPLFMLPTSEPQSIESLIDSLCNFGTTAGSTPSKEPTKQDLQANTQSKDPFDQEYNEQWRKFIHVPADSINSDAGRSVLPTLEHQSFTRATTGDNYTVDFEADKEKPADQRQGIPKRHPPTKLHQVRSLPLEWEPGNIDLVNTEDPLQSTSRDRPQDGKIPAPTRPATVAVPPARAVIPTKPKTKPSAPFIPAVPDPDDHWRAFVFDGLSDRSSLSRDSTPDPDLASESNVDVHTHSPAKTKIKSTQPPQHTSLNANASSSSPTSNQIQDSSLLSTISPPPLSSHENPQDNPFCSSSSLSSGGANTTFATAAPTVPQRPSNNNTESSPFSRPSSLANASTTAAVLRTQRPPRHLHQHHDPHQPRSLSSDDPLTRLQPPFGDQNKPKGKGTGKETNTNEGKHNPSQKILFRPPIPFGSEIRTAAPRVQHIGRQVALGLGKRRAKGERGNQ